MSVASGVRRDEAGRRDDNVQRDEAARRDDDDVLGDESGGRREPLQLAIDELER